MIDKNLKAQLTVWRKKPQLMTTRALIELAKRGQKQDFNRQLNDAMIKEDFALDAVHGLQLIMLHEHKAGVKSEPHYRCLVYFADKTQACLDVGIEDYNAIFFPAIP